jgi:hypothetical protein
MAICLDSQVHPKGELVSDLAALHQSVDIALSLNLIEAVLSGALGYEIVVVLERGQILLGEFAPFRPDFIADGLLGPGGSIQLCCSRIGSNIGHVIISNIDAT